MSGPPLPCLGYPDDLRPDILLADLEEAVEFFEQGRFGLELGNEVETLAQVVDLVGEPAPAPRVHLGYLTLGPHELGEALDCLFRGRLVQPRVKNDHSFIVTHIASLRTSGGPEGSREREQGGAAVHLTLGWVQRPSAAHYKEGYRQNPGHFGGAAKKGSPDGRAAASGEAGSRRLPRRAAYTAMTISTMERANTARTKIFSAMGAGGGKGFGLVYHHQPETKSTASLAR